MSHLTDVGNDKEKLAQQKYSHPTYSVYNFRTIQKDESRKPPEKKTYKFIFQHRQKSKRRYKRDDTNKHANGHNSNGRQVSRRKKVFQKMIAAPQKRWNNNNRGNRIPESEQKKHTNDDDNRGNRISESSRKKNTEEDDDNIGNRAVEFERSTKRYYGLDNRFPHLDSRKVKKRKKLNKIKRKQEKGDNGIK